MHYIGQLLGFNFERYFMWALLKNKLVILYSMNYNGSTGTEEQIQPLTFSAGHTQNIRLHYIMLRIKHAGRRENGRYRNSPLFHFIKST